MFLLVGLSDGHHGNYMAVGRNNRPCGGFKGFNRIYSFDGTVVALTVMVVVMRSGMVRACGNVVVIWIIFAADFFIAICIDISVFVCTISPSWRRGGSGPSYGSLLYASMPSKAGGCIHAH